MSKKKRWLSFLLSVAMVVGSVAPAGTVYAEDLFSSGPAEITQEAEEMPEMDAFSEEEADLFQDESTDAAETAEFPEDLLTDGTEDIAVPQADGTELPSYIFGETWNAQYDIVYYEAGKAYVYNGQAVTFPDEDTVAVGDTVYNIRNKETVVTVAEDENGDTIVSLSNLAMPVGKIDSKWNSTSSGGANQIVYNTDIPGIGTVSSASSNAYNKPLVLTGAEPGTYHLTGGVLFEKANPYSPGFDFGDGKGTVKERNFGCLPDITVTVGTSTPEEPEEPDAYLGVNAGSAVPESFTNDLWLQYDYKEMSVGETAKLNPRRVEEATVNKITNDVEMPHFNYEIIKGDSVGIDVSNNAHAVVTAVKEGTSVVKVTYDAFTHSNGDVSYPACDPVNTAYVVYSVGGNSDITIQDNIVNKAADKTDAADVVFRSYDTMYFTEGESVPFTLKASAQGAESLKVKCNGMTVAESGEGTYVLPLENRSNIIEITAKAADGTTRSKYHVLDARKIKINVANKTNPGKILREGDTAVVSFTGITMPVYKLATIYNPCMDGWGAKATNVHYVCNGTLYTGACKQWDLAEKNSFEAALEQAGTYDFTNGSIYCEWWGSGLGADKTTDNPGEPNLNAPVLKDEFSFMPNFSIKVAAPEKPEEPEEPDAYLGVNAGSAVPESFTNDLWLQYDYKEMNVGDTAKITPRRVEEAITDTINNDLELPHFNYEIIRGESVAIDVSDNAHAVVNAVKEGTSVVKVTYDAYTHSKNKFFPACDPVNTAYVVYSVGGNSDIIIKDNIAGSEAEKTDAADILFRSYDTLYFTEGESVPFTLKASAQGAESLKVKCNGITVAESGEGTYVLPLENRSNIIEITAKAADGTTRSKYHVLDARKIKINVENKTNPGQPLHAGEIAAVSFTGITMPVYKLATIYNPCFGSSATNVHYDCNGKTYVGRCKQWDLAEKNSFDVAVTSAGTYAFTNGGIACSWWGDNLGSDKVKDGPGKENINANTLKGEFSFMPNFSFEAGEGVSVESVSLDKEELNLTMGETETLKASFNPENAVVLSTKWKSADESIAVVDADGNVTAVAPGTTTITVNADGKEAVCTVNVKKIELTAITLSDENVSLYVGKTHKLAVEYTPSNILDEDKGITYTSSDEKIAKVDEKGVITGAAEGTAEITAVSKANPSVQAVCRVEVQAVKLESLVLSEEEVTLKPGTSKELKAAVTPEDAADLITLLWSSSDENVAVVDQNGNVIALKEGICEITVQAKETDKKASCKVTVKAAESAGIIAVLDPENTYDGDKVTVTLTGVNRPKEVTDPIHQENVSYKTNIPGLSKVAGSTKEISFTVPQGTPTGTYYLTDGSYFAEYGGYALQGVFWVNKKQITCYEGQMPAMKIHVVNREEIRNAAISDLNSYVDLAQYRPKQQEIIKSLLTKAEANINAAMTQEEIDKIVGDTKDKLISVKTNAQITEEELAAGKRNAISELDTYKNPDDYRLAERMQIALITAMAKLEVVGAATQEEIDKIVADAKAKMDAFKTDKELTEEEKEETPVKPVPKPEKTKPVLTLKVAAGKTSAKLTWNKVAGADGYKIYAGQCGKSIKMVKDVKNGKTLTWNYKGLKKGTYYRYYVLAYKNVNDKKVALTKSLQMHVTTTGGKYGNAKTMKVSKTAVSLKKGKTAKVTVKLTNTKKLVKKHVAFVRYMSSNPSVAKVSKNGVIKGMKKGTCYVYCYAQNGIYKRVKVTVK